jgi:hypothetical protein
VESDVAFVSGQFSLLSGEKFRSIEPTAKAIGNQISRPMRRRHTGEGSCREENQRDEVVQRESAEYVLC